MLNIWNLRAIGDGKCHKPAYYTELVGFFGMFELRPTDETHLSEDRSWTIILAVEHFALFRLRRSQSPHEQLPPPFCATTSVVLFRGAEARCRRETHLLAI